MYRAIVLRCPRQITNTPPYFAPSRLRVKRQCVNSHVISREAAKFAKEKGGRLAATTARICGLISHPGAQE